MIPVQQWRAIADRDDRVGQVSTYIKPLMLIIIVVLFLFLISTLLDFRVGLEEQSQQIDFYEESRQNFQKITNCLLTEGAASNQRLNISELLEFDRTYLYREPPCAEDFQYGYEAVVNEKFPRGRQYLNPQVDLVFVVDMSASIRGYDDEKKDTLRETGNGGEIPAEADLEVLCNAQTDIVNELERRGFNVRFTVYGLTEVHRCATQNLSAEGVDRGEDIVPTHNEDWGKGVEWVSRYHSWRDGATRIVFPMTDECPAAVGPMVGYEGWSGYPNPTNSPIIEPCPEQEPGVPHSEETQRAIDAALDNQVTIIPILGDPLQIAFNTRDWDWHRDYATDMAEATGGDVFDAREDDNLEQEIIDMVIDNTFIPLNPETTCVVPSQDTWGLEADVAVTLEATEGMDDEWGEVCDSLSSIEAGLRQRGWLSELTVYAPPTDGVPGGDGTPMEYNGETYGQSMPDELQECIDEQANWVSGTFDENTDYGPASWGTTTEYILQNHDWNDVEQRAVISIGSHRPTGGRGESGWDEAGITNDIIAAANDDDNDVSINFITDGDWGTRSDDQYDPAGTNDVRAVMEDIASQTGGTVQEYLEAGEVSERIMDSVQEDPGAVCEDQEYRFGEREGSEGGSQQDDMTMTFPVTIQRTPNYVTHGEVMIRMRDGALERLVGAVNQVTKTGEEQGSPVTATLQVTSEEQMRIEEDYTVERPVETEYRLVDGNGDQEIEVDTNLVVGVNGFRVLETDGVDPARKQITDTSFTGYEGDSLQVIATNEIHDEMYLDELYVECAPGEDCALDDPQPILTDGIDYADGDSGYDERGRLGVFYRNFTQLTMGSTEETEETAICISTSGDDSCSVIRADSIETDGVFPLPPGTHLLEISYNPATGTVTIDE